MTFLVLRTFWLGAVPSVFSANSFGRGVSYFCSDTSDALKLPPMFLELNSRFFRPSKIENRFKNMEFRNFVLNRYFTPMQLLLDFEIMPFSHHLVVEVEI